MALFRCMSGGAGSLINIAAPDIISQATMAQGATRTIAVTQKPRYVILLTNRQNDTTGRGQAFCYDSENDQYVYAAYTSEGYQYTKQGSGTPNLITSVTSSTVGLYNLNAASIRTSCLIYY